MSYKEKAKEKLTGKWLPSMGIVVLYSILSGFVGYMQEYSNLLFILSQIVFMLIAVGFALYFLRLVRYEEDFTDLFLGFKDMQQAMGYLGVGLLTGLIVLLGYILLIIPGIILSYSYKYSILIKYDNPELSVWEAMEESKNIMQGRKMDAFILDLSFIGWYILGFIAFFVGVIPVSVYHQTAITEFYEKAREDYYGVKNGEPYRYMDGEYNGENEENEENEETFEEDVDTVTSKDTDSNLY